jgi:hypothetical protein
MGGSHQCIRQKRKSPLTAFATGGSCHLVCVAGSIRQRQIPMHSISPVAENMPGRMLAWSRGPLATEDLWISHYLCRAQELLDWRRVVRVLTHLPCCVNVANRSLPSQHRPL